MIILFLHFKSEVLYFEFNVRLDIVSEVESISCWHNNTF